MVDAAEKVALLVTVFREGATPAATRKSPPPEVEAEWHELVEGVNDQIRGKIVPAEMFDEAHRVLKEYRAAHPQKRE